MEDKYLYTEIDARYEAEDRMIAEEDAAHAEFDRDLRLAIEVEGFNVKDYDYVDDLQEVVSFIFSQEELESLDRMGVL